MSKMGIVYLVSVVVANIGFTHLPMIPLPYGGVLAPMSFLVGLVFVFRDYAQREVGHKVLGFMGGGVLASYILADPFVALASAVAFAISELVDWLIYTVYRKPLRDRILVSSAVSTPVDSAVFMLMLGFFSWYGLVVMVASKMVGALVVYYSLKRRG
jgi:uncharacterized PurR-regulated membrane protein YhhQ (DUF165 family)